MQIARWPTHGHSNKENAGLKVRPGIFSNPANIVAHYHNEYNQRAKTPPPGNYEQRFSRDLSNNLSIDSYGRMISQITTDNDGTTMLEMNMAELQYDPKSYNDSGISYKPLIDRTNLSIQQKSFKQEQSSFKHSSSDANLRASADSSLSKGKRQNSYAQLSHNKGSQKQLASVKSTSTKHTPTRTPKTAKQRGSSIENNENIDVNIFMLPQQSTANNNKLKVTTTEKKRKTNSDFGVRQEFTEDETERLRRENQELSFLLKKAQSDLLNEQNKTSLLENELNSLTNSITEERSKYQNELLKISAQIKKLRNIQNNYVNEKKNSERLESQLNAKEKVLGDVSAFLW